MNKRLDLPLDQQLSYDRETGNFIRLISRPHSPTGSRADLKLDTHGYRVVRVGGKEHRAHRLAWFIVHGYWPLNDIDHINRDRADNRLENLRCATRSENLRNSSPRRKMPSRAKCVYLHKRTGRWIAYVIAEGKPKYLGYHATRELAMQCHIEAKEMLYGVQVNS